MADSIISRKYRDFDITLHTATSLATTLDCHLSVAHAYDWKAYRPDVRSLAATIRSAKVVTPN